MFKLIKRLIAYPTEIFFLIFVIAFFYLSISSFSKNAFALDSTLGEQLFIKNCSGCHINGGNIIRRNKTLKLKDLKRNNIDNPEAIAKIARNGIGSMSGYKDKLGDNGDNHVAQWIWDQSQKAWVQG